MEKQHLAGGYQESTDIISAIQMNILNRKSIQRLTIYLAAKGEEAFRDMETDTVREFACSLKKSVLSVGGGLPLRKVNRELLSR